MIQRVVNIVGTTPPSGPRRVSFGDRPLLSCTAAEDEPDTPYGWGYVGFGPELLARSILYAVLGDRRAAEDLSHEYMMSMFAGLTVDNWTLPSCEVLAWVEGRPERSRWIARN